MDNRIIDEQRKIADHFSGLSEEERKKQLMAMVDYLHTEAQERDDG